MFSEHKKLNQPKTHQKDDSNREDFYKKIFSEIPCYISVQNEHLKIVASNKKFRTDFGGKKGSYCYEVYKHRSSPCIICPVLLTFDDGQSHSTEEIVTTIAGKQHNVITWTSPLCDEKGVVTQVIEVSSDITAIRELQDRLTSLGLMISSVSHGLRGMLTALDGGIYKFETGIEKHDNNRIVSAFTQVKQVVGRIRKTILEILYYAKSRQFNFEKVSITSLSADLSEDFIKRCEDNNINFKIINLADSEYLEVDYSWFSAALSNFIDNSIDACVSNKREPSPYVAVSIRTIGSNQIEFLIQDNGIGMRREVKDKLFTLFFSSKGSQGTGLGLFIANQVVSQHGGSIDLETNYLKGTTVKINMPVRQLNR